VRLDQQLLDQVGADTVALVRRQQLDAGELQGLGRPDHAQPAGTLPVDLDDVRRAVRHLAANLLAGPLGEAAPEGGLVEVGGQPPLRAGRDHDDVGEEHDVVTGRLPQVRGRLRDHGAQGHLRNVRRAGGG
jgi:hypothetical protein